MTESIVNSLESKPLRIGQIIVHRQYGVGVISNLLPNNPTLLKAVFEGEEVEQIVQTKYVIPKVGELYR